MEQSPVLTPAS